MFRRDFFTAAAVGTGAALLAGSSLAASTDNGRGKQQSGARRLSGSMIQTRDGAELFYRDWGTGQPVVFLSGWTLPSESWSYVMTPLSESMRCVAFDRRGHGRSSDPGRGYDYDTLANDLADVLEALDLRDVTLVAHSMSGGEAARYLSRVGSKRIARLVLVATTLPYLTRTADNPFGVEAQVFEQARQNFLLKDFPKWLRDNARPFVVAETSTEIMDWLHGMMMQCSMKAVIECNRAFTSTDFRAEVAKITVPTLLIHGDKDVSSPIPISAARVEQIIPGAKLQVYAGAPHGIFVTHAAQIVTDLRAFIRTA